MSMLTDQIERLREYGKARDGEIASLVLEAADTIETLRAKLHDDPARVFTSLYIRDKYSGMTHRIGDDRHDMIYVDDEGTIHYSNLQNGDGCIGYKSVNKETISDKYPAKDWGKRKDEYTYGYEFIPNLNEYGYPFDPIHDNKEVSDE